MTDTIENRLRRFEDGEAVRQTWCEYFYALDSLNWSALADLYTEDGIVEMVGLGKAEFGEDDRQFRGREEVIEGFYKPGMVAGASPEHGQFYTGHYGTNMLIDVQGDEATGLACHLQILGNTNLLAGAYQNRFRRDPDRWRIAHCRISIRYAATIAASDIAGLSLADVLSLPPV